MVSQLGSPWWVFDVRAAWYCFPRSRHRSPWTEWVVLGRVGCIPMAERRIHWAFRGNAQRSGPIVREMLRFIAFGELSYTKGTDLSSLCSSMEHLTCLHPINNE